MLMCSLHPVAKLRFVNIDWKSLELNILAHN